MASVFVLSIFVSTAMSSVYSVYNMVFIAINSIVNTVYLSTNYKLGQTYNRDIKKYIHVHDLFNSIFVGGMCLLMSTTYIMMPSFIKLYTKGINDIDYSYKWLPLLFCLIQIFSWSRSIAGNLISVAGRIKNAVWVSVVEAVLNLTLSIVLVNIIDIMGVVLATVIALPLKIIYNNYIGDNIILKRSIGKTVKILLVNLCGFLIVVFISEYLVEWVIDSWVIFAIYGLVVLVINGLIFVGMNYLCNNDLKKAYHLLKI